MPVTWQHPTQPNPYWREQHLRALQQGRPGSRLHGHDERFVGLFATPLSVAQRDWDEGKRAWEAGDESHPDVRWELDYHVRGYFSKHDGQQHQPKPITVYADDGDTIVWEGLVSSWAELLQHRPWEHDHGGRPVDGYMPDFDVPEDELGWCLYETVSEGTPVTPVFATVEELVEHLATVGEDWDQKPYRREAAERLVASGSSFGSFVTVDGRVLDGAKDLDVLEEVLPRDRT